MIISDNNLANKRFYEASSNLGLLKRITVLSGGHTYEIRRVTTLT